MADSQWPGAKGAPGPQQPVHSLTPVLRGVDVFFIVASTMVVLCRFYSRVIYKKNAGLDDAVALIAWAATIAETSVEIAASPGTGLSLKEIPHEWIPQFFQLVFVAQMLYLLASGLVRLSIVAFLPRLSQFEKFRRVLLGVAIFIILQTIAFVTTGLILYIPGSFAFGTTPKSIARTPQAERKFYDAHQAIGLAVDLFLLATPIWLICTNSFRFVKNLNVIFIFSVGLFAIVADIIRFVMVSRINNASIQSNSFFNVSLWTTLELHIGLWVACFPALVPLLRCAAQKLGSGVHSSKSDLGGPKPTWKLQGNGHSSDKKDSLAHIEEAGLTGLEHMEEGNVETYDHADDKRMSESSRQMDVGSGSAF